MIKISLAALLESKNDLNVIQISESTHKVN